MLLAFSFPALAQRMTPGRQSVEVYGSFGRLGHYYGPAGGGVLRASHGYRGRLTLGVDVMGVNMGLTEEEVVEEDKETGDVTVVRPGGVFDFKGTDICASVGYLYRVWAPRSRVFVLSAGGSGLLGARCCGGLHDHVRSADGSNVKYYPSVGLVLGLVPEVQAEVFPFRNVSLYGSLRPRMTVVSTNGGDSDWLRMGLAMGLKFYL